MDALEQVDIGQAEADMPPLLAGLQPTVVSNSLWQKIVTATEQRLLTPRGRLRLARWVIIRLRRPGNTASLGKGGERCEMLRHIAQPQLSSSRAKPIMSQSQCFIPLNFDMML